MDKPKKKQLLLTDQFFTKPSNKRLCVAPDSVNVPVISIEATTSNQTDILPVSEDAAIPDGHFGMPDALIVPETAVCAELDIGNAVGKKLSDSVKNAFLETPWTPPAEYDFPRMVEIPGQSARQFHLKYLNEYRPWLIYSAKLEGVFCKYCVLFAIVSAQKQQQTFVTAPLRKWTKFHESAKSHRASEYHDSAMRKGKAFSDIMAGKSQDIATLLDKKLQNERKIVHDGVLSIVKAVLVCGRQGLAMRGHDDNRVIDPEKDYFSSDLSVGNFNALLHLQISSGDAALARHLKESGGKAEFSTSRAQNEIVDIAGKIIRGKILERVKTAKYYSILADGTTDIGKIDQFSIVLRYALKGCLYEDFVDFVDVSGSTTGSALADTLLQWLTKSGLNVNNLRGQGYDGAANMTGIIKGVKSRILELYPKALFTHCSAHVLNLSLGDSCSLLEIKKMFGTVNDIAVFFQDSTKRNAILEEHLPKDAAGKRLQILCPTRWPSRSLSVDRLWDFFGAVLSALSDVEEKCDAQSTSRASGLKADMTTFPFLIALGIARVLLDFTLRLSTLLQNVQLDYAKAMAEVNNLITILAGYRERAEVTFLDIFHEVVQLAEAVQVAITIPRRTGRQTTRCNVQTDSPEEYYRISLYVPFLDHLLSSLRDRFSDSVQKATKISRLLPSFIVDQNEDFSDLLEIYQSDLPNAGRSFASECVRWKSYWSEKDKESRPVTILSALQSCDKDYFPNIAELLTIFTVLPVTVAECERSFSTLRRLKTYLRSTMRQDRLVGLALLNIHSDLPVSPEKVRDAFLCAENRRKY